MIFDVQPEDILGRDVKRVYSRPRQAAMAVCLAYGFGPVSIGRRMNRDHSTVCTGARNAQGRAEIDPAFAEKLDTLFRRFNLERNPYNER